VAELAAETADTTAAATRTLIIAQAVRNCVETLLAARQKWPVGWRSTLHTLSSMDPELHKLAEAALLSADADSAVQLIDRVTRYAAGDTIL
jgi:hypothetical protein